MDIISAIIILGAAAVAAYYAPMLHRTRDVRRLQRFCTRTKTLVLTFDDGPDPNMTPLLLDLLNEYSAHATFFSLGRRAIASPLMLDRIRAAGHEVGTHSHEHHNAWHVLPWKSASDVSRGFESIRNWISPTRLFRPPYGKTTLAAALSMRYCGGQFGWWTVDSEDSRAKRPGVETLVDRIRSKSGGVVLFHDLARSSERTEFIVQAVRALLEIANKQQLRIMTLGDALQAMRHPRTIRSPHPRIDTSLAPQLSIVIVNWNRSDLLEACLRSIYARSTSRQWEVIVVDNASTDDSVDVLRSRFPQVQLLANTTNLGFAAANNQGIRASSGKYILLLNSDTEILGSAIEESLAYMERSQPVGVMGVRTLNPDRSLQLTCFRFPSLINMLLLMLGAHRLPWPQVFGRDRMRHWRRHDERDVDVVSGCYFFVRRAAFESVGLLDEQFFFYDEETDWCMRARELGWAVRFAPVGEIIHHGGASSMLLEGRSGSYFAESRVRLHRKHRGLPSAAASWWILICSNVIRALGFGALSIATGHGRWRHLTIECFRNASRVFRAWPSDRTARVSMLATRKSTSSRRAA